jgi:tRNA pseudouridine38-40 synthase
VRNIKLTIEYDGSNYCGWQIQDHVRCFVSGARKSIQEVIEETLRRILQEEIRLVASGRTDAGVHALAQVANFKTQSSISAAKLQLALNSLLPQDISIARIEEVSLGFHSRFQAKSKIYRYTILNRNYPSALMKGRVYFYPFPLNLKLMRQAARHFLGRRNFKAFCASGSGAKSTIRTIKRISIKKARYALCGVAAWLVIIDIEANGFLYNMARNLTGTLVEVGKGKLSVDSARRLLACGDRRLAGPTLPAHGLSLIKVKYK